MEKSLVRSSMEKGLRQIFYGKNKAFVGSFMERRHLSGLLWKEDFLKVVRRSLIVRRSLRVFYGKKTLVRSFIGRRHSTGLLRKEDLFGVF